MKKIGAVILVPRFGHSAAEQLMQRAHQAAALDLIHTLQEAGVDQIVVGTPSSEWIPLSLSVICDEDPPGIPFHFGTRLSELTEKYPARALIYMGGGSAPLLDPTTAGMLTGLIERALDQSGTVPTHIALTNNQRWSDWVGISRVEDALHILRAADSDNGLAAALKASGDYEVRVIAGVRPASSMDMDSPADLAFLSYHLDTQPHLRDLINQSAELNAIPVNPLLETLQSPDKTLLLAGRVSPLAWGALEKAARCRIQVITDPAGLTRLSNGSLTGVIEMLAGLADAVILDNRILLKGASLAALFQAELRQVGDDLDQHSAALLRAVSQATIPILMGGNSLVTGGLYALAEIIQNDARRV